MASLLMVPDDGPFLLVAHDDLRDPNFRRAVVLVLHHSAEGSFGLVLNRPLDKALADVVPDVDPRAAAVPLFVGGPVSTDALQFLARAERPGQVVLPGLTAGLPLEQLLEVESNELHAYAGYAGWGAGQLQGELGEGAWVVAPAQTRHVFDVPPSRLWSTVLRELGPTFTWMSLAPDDPRDN